MNHRTAPMAVLVVLLAGLGLGLAAGCGDDARFVEPTVVDAWDVVVLGGETVRVELALDGDSRRNGLMHRTTLADDQGMLFVFPIVEPRTFWMRNTLIPLDILFCEDDGTIINIRSNCPPGVERPGFHSLRPCRIVLELRGGWCEERGVVAGDRVEFEPGLIERARL